MAGESIEQTYAASAQQVWDALRQTVAEFRYKDVREDPSAGTMEFRTGLSWSSWRGQQMTATVRELSPGQTQLTLTGGLALKVQVTSWGEKEKIANKVHGDVARRLGAPAPAA
jgi:hypothetical protein